MTKQLSSIGIFDSGIGGLTVAKHIQRTLPHEHVLYLADQVNLPYGEKSQEEIFQLSKAAIPTLIAEGAKVIVVACNSASVAVIEMLRETYPETPFVSVVPAVKQAAERTASGTVAVFATRTTLKSALYQQLKEDHAKRVTVIDIACPEWVGMIESGTFAEQTVAKPVRKALEAGADQLVLGCTHYPFLSDQLRTIVDGQAELLESGPGVARQVKRVLEANGMLEQSGSGSITCLTSGDSSRTTKVAQKLTGEALSFRPVGR